MNYLNKHLNLIYAGILFLICILMYCINLAGYPFMDSDETKFVLIAKEMLTSNDWINLKLNGNDIFASSPFEYWIANISCLLFGKISCESVRLPISIFSTVGILILYFALAKILTKTYSFIISLIMTTSIGVLYFSHLATNDIFYTVVMMTLFLCTYLKIFSREKEHVFWCIIYFLTALAFLCSGLFGLVIAIFSIVAMQIFTGNLKEIFKLKNYLPGLIIFLLAALPYPIIMICKYGVPFIGQYLNAYNLFNYLSLKNVFNAIGLFIVEFSPWIFSFLWILGKNIKGICNSILSYFKDNSQDKLNEKWRKLNKIDKFLSLNTIVFFTSLIFAILYGYKFTYLVLFLTFPAACISGHYWYEYIIKKEHDKSIFFATMIPNLILIICSIIGLFGHNTLLNKWLFHGLNHLIIPLVIIFFIIPLIGIFAIILKGRIIPYTANIILMFSLSFVMTPSIFNFIALNNGEKDILSFIETARKKETNLAAYVSTKKYSLPYYYDKSVPFLDSSNLNTLRDYLISNPKTLVIVEIKDMMHIENENIKYMLVDTGKKYCLIQHMANELQKDIEEKEPEVLVF